MREKLADGGMNTEALCGQLLVVGFDGATLPSDIAQALSRAELGGVILFKRNLPSLQAVHELTTSIRDPSATVALGFRAVTLQSGGERIEGVVKGEDAFSVQVVTVDGALRAFRNQGLGELTRGTESLMPVFDESRLSDAALEDLLAYLGTLRGAQ